MCGILSLITINQDEKDVDIPCCIPQNELITKSIDDQPFQIWETLQTNTFLHQDLIRNIKELSNQDIKKLNNLDKLRSLTLELNKLNNRINKQKKTKIKTKKNKKKDDEEVEQVQDKSDPIDIDKKIRLVKLQINEIMGQDESESDQNESSPITESQTISQETFESLIYKVSNRGPDYLNYTQFQQHANDLISFQLFSSILSLRQPFTTQPIITSNHQFILQFNGELYNDECLLENDTQFIMDKLSQSPGSRRENIFNILNELKGEFAFILYDLLHSVVYFGRDKIGKRSLVYLWKKTDQDDQQLLISSIPEVNHHEGQFIECENKIYEFDLHSKQLQIFDYINHDQCYTPLKFNDDIPNEQQQISKVYQALKSSTYKRQLSINPLHHEEIEGSRPSLAILFSGGLDCTIIASLICENIIDYNLPNKTIDLLTVGFDNPRINQLANNSPDRILAKKSWFYLQKKYPTINIRLIEINVSYKHWLIHKQRVLDLIYPSNTEMDLSIGIAFYFASGCNDDLTTKSQFKSVITSEVTYDDFIKDETVYIDVESKYMSKAKVLFSGLGADELFAGYSRHESIFQNITEQDDVNQLYDKLSSELINDIEIIYKRNLGRDDRVICCWGKELRYPYLDEEFITLVINEIEPNLKLNIMNDKKLIRKYLLRQLANDKLQLSWVKDELKRAIQFGAKSAKLEIGQNKIKGTDIL
ncbi:glucosamine 6-phosphate synthetase [Scheffersomyces coipomensis]|uniref:glucosamine 6-phosphate synthetase n=1 Tax=Scheffersomyces coipomensis TaxID=1788519 RepID=UPI00315DC08F